MVSLVFSDGDHGCRLIEPPQPIKRFYYRCDNKFHIDQLLELYEDPKHYGLIYVSGSELIIYSVHTVGAELRNTVLYKKSVKLQKSQKKGGQSAARIGRLHDEHHKAYITLMAEKVAERLDDFRALIIAGPAEKKQKLADELHDKYCANIAGLFTCESNEDIFERYYDPIIEIMETIEFAEDAKLVAEFTDPRNSDNVAIGKQEVNENLALGRVSTVLVHKDHIQSGRVNVKKLETKCRETGANVFVINSHSVKFLKDYGGIGALLRY